MNRDEKIALGVVGGLAVAGAAAVLIANAIKAPVAPAEKGHLSIFSDPSEASITIDGAASGVTSRRFDLDAGSHVVSLSLSGYITETRTVQIAAGESQDLYVTLTISSGTFYDPYDDLYFPTWLEMANYILEHHPGYGIPVYSS